MFLWEGGNPAVREHFFSSVLYLLLRPSIDEVHPVTALVNVRWDLLDPFLMRIVEARRIFKSNVCRPQTFGQTHISPCCPTSKDFAINLNHPNARNWVFFFWNSVMSTFPLSPESLLLPVNDRQVTIDAWDSQNPKTTATLVEILLEKKKWWFHSHSVLSCLMPTPSVGSC